MQYNHNFFPLDCFLGRMFLGGARKDEMFSVLRQMKSPSIWSFLECQHQQQFLEHCNLTLWWLHNQKQKKKKNERSLGLMARSWRLLNYFLEYLKKLQVCGVPLTVILGGLWEDRGGIPLVILQTLWFLCTIWVQFGGSMSLYIE